MKKRPGYAVVLRLRDEAKTSESFPTECAETARHGAVAIVPRGSDTDDYFARLKPWKKSDLPAPIEQALVAAGTKFVKDRASTVAPLFAEGGMAHFSATFSNVPAEAVVQTLAELGFTVVDGDDLLTDPKERLKRRVARFSWPDEAPTTLEEAWRLLERNPIPWDCGRVHPGATDVELDEAETALGQPLPRTLREALATHNGIESSFPPYLTPSWLLASEWERFRSDWSEALEEAGDEEWEGDIEPGSVDPIRLFVVGREAGGHICYLLDSSLTNADGEPPVLLFDPEGPCLRRRWRSLGHYIGWVICDVHGDPQKPPSATMKKLFP